VILCRFDNRPMPALLWDVYCRVVDNLGDAGVCWRLAANLAARGQRVRLVIDDAAPLAFMAPQGATGVEVLTWPGPAEPGDVVIEAFGCDPPPATVAAMARRRPAPVWINLEYLSAEDYVERSHRLPSPQRNGLTKWFFYPGFTARAGGLLREPDLMAQRACFDRAAWLQALGAAPQPTERVVALFCYDNPALPLLLSDLAREPTLMLVTPGAAQRQMAALARPSTPLLRAHHLPWVSQADFDRLLWASDLNFVRGEDSLVRAIWAGAPFVWQAYPQHDGAHHAKVEALLAQMQMPADWAAAWRSWNGATAAWPGVPAAWHAAAGAWRKGLLAQPDLVTQLISFVETRPGATPG
jgi:uncharacterized repeat protein (TIGR03837 family)